MDACPCRGQSRPEAAPLGSGRGKIIDALVSCGHCGSERLLPLTFTIPYRHETDDGSPVPAGRPVLKCLSCGRRLRHEEVDAAQKLFQRIFVPVTLAALALTGLDFRFGWSRHWPGPVPLAVVLAAQALAVAGYWFVFWVMKTNAFASSTIQVEAGQSVIQSGPYALVRHPMYLGMITMSLASPLALGSYMALPVFALLVPVFIYRLIHEERTLRRELEGYGEYCARVRHRLIPHLW